MNRNGSPRNFPRVYSVLRCRCCVMPEVELCVDTDIGRCATGSKLIEPYVCKKSGVACNGRSDTERDALCLAGTGCPCLSASLTPHAAAAGVECGQGVRKLTTAERAARGGAKPEHGRAATNSARSRARVWQTSSSPLRPTTVSRQPRTPCSQPAAPRLPNRAIPGGRGTSVLPLLHRDSRPMDICLIHHHT